MPDYKLKIERNHLLADLETGLALVDTGSPVTHGAGQPLEIGGAHYEPSANLPDLLPEISREVGTEVSWLIGTDVLGAWVVVLDWNSGEIRFERSPFEVSGTEILVDLPRGVPLLDISVEGRTVKAVLDSGAQRSYADPKTATTHASVGVGYDFYPMLRKPRMASWRPRRFETQLYRVPLVVGGREIDVQWGILPDGLRHLLRVARWILGVDFFRNRRIVLDFANGRVVDST